MNEAFAIQQINKMNIALAEVNDLYSALDFVDKAKAAKILLDAAGLGKHAQEVKIVQLRAERLAGQYIKEMPKASGTRGAGRPSLGGNTMLPPKNETPTYNELGITKMQASRWKQVASLPDERFEEIIEKARESQKELTQAAVIKEAKQNARIETLKRVQNEIATGEIDALLDFRMGDFRELMKALPDNSIDLIFTDPPYDDKTIHLYEDLAILAKSKLKTGGSLLCYGGHHAIPMYLELMTPHLRYWWTIAIKQSGRNARLIGKHVFVEWKPVLWFVNGGRRKDKRFVADAFETKLSDVDKTHHKWQQHLIVAEYYINHLTEPGDVVLDPFAGGGTTLIAASKNHRRCIGFEIDPDAYNRALVRLTL